MALGDPQFGPTHDRLVIENRALRQRLDAISELAARGKQFIRCLSLQHGDPCQCSSCSWLIKLLELAPQIPCENHAEREALERGFDEDDQ